MQVIAANHPLRSDLVPVPAREGMTLAEILEQAQPDPILRAHAHIFVGDVKVPRERWNRVRPKESAIVTIRVVPQGGGGGGDKNPLRTILTIAVVVAAAYVGQSQTVIAAMGGGAAGAAGAAVLGSAISIPGPLATNMECYP